MAFKEDIKVDVNKKYLRLYNVWKGIYYFKIDPKNIHYDDKEEMECLVGLRDKARVEQFQKEIFNAIQGEGTIVTDEQKIEVGRKLALYIEKVRTIMQKNKRDCSSCVIEAIRKLDEEDAEEVKEYKSKNGFEH